jgi:hypothetical protein
MVYQHELAALFIAAKEPTLIAVADQPAAIRKALQLHLYLAIADLQQGGVAAIFKHADAIGVVAAAHQVRSGHEAS